MIVHITLFGSWYWGNWVFHPVSYSNSVCNQIHQSCGPLQNSHFPLETSGAPLPYLNQPYQGNPLGCSLTNGMDSQSSMHPLDLAFCRPMNSQHPFLNGVSDAASQVKMQPPSWLLSLDHIHMQWHWGWNVCTSQVGAFWQDDLQSVVHMDIGQSQEIAPTSSNSYNGMKKIQHPIGRYLSWQTSLYMSSDVELPFARFIANSPHENGALT
jgi:hypothetical protein